MKPIIFKGIVLAAVLLLAFILYITIPSREKRVYYHINTVPITSIKYKEIRENSGQGDGRVVSIKIYTYSYPDKLKIESGIEERIIEVYNEESYLYYDIKKNTLIKKECFPADKPYVLEIENRIKNIVKDGIYEFFGYEEKDNKKLEVIGVKFKDNEKSYMHKLWIWESKGLRLPVTEEYFIDNRVVSKVSYIYFNINETIPIEEFEIKTFPDIKIEEGGAMPKYCNSFDEAQKYLNFKLKLPQMLPIGLIPTEIGVIPPVKNPSFYCIYSKNGYRVYMDEEISKEEFETNVIIGKTKCWYNIKEQRVIIKWRQGDIIIVLNGDIELREDIIYLFINLSGEKLAGIMSME